MAAFVLGLMLAVVAMGAGTPVWTPPTSLPAIDGTTATTHEAEVGLEEHMVEVTRRVSAFGCTALGNGTAVAVTGHGLLTSRHVVAGARLINVSADLSPTQVASASLHNGSVDLAQLSVPGPKGPSLELADHDAAPGDRLITAGFAGDALGVTVRRARLLGYLDGIQRGHPGPVMQLDVRAVEGMSGGPVVNEHGELVGILFAVQDPPGSALAIPASAVSDSIATGAFAPDIGCLSSVPPAAARPEASADHEVPPARGR